VAAAPDWIARLRASLGSEKVAMVSILATEGSAPRGAGVRMLVGADWQHGTIGGGRLEYQAIEQARAVLDHAAGSWRIQDYPLGPLLGQCCGGRVRLMIEHVDPAGTAWIEEAVAGRMLVSRLAEDRVVRTVEQRALSTPLPARGDRPGVGTVIVDRVGQERHPVALFGAGHVGQAVAAALAPLPFSLAWFDSREEYASVPGVTPIATADLGACIADIAPGAAILILTHDHDLDYRITVEALKSPAAFVGLIGSATKRARFLARLARDGVDAARLTCPIGLADVRGKEPEVIAISVAAQMLALFLGTPSLVR